QGFDKWREVQEMRPITGTLGNDAHRNVGVDPVCSGIMQPVCEAVAMLFPNSLTLLITGGSIILSDGDRVDSYARISRWVENRLFVTGLTIEQIDEAVREGRSYGVFSVFGDPYGFVFDGFRGSEYFAMGSVVEGGGVTLRVHAPVRPRDNGGAPFYESDAVLALVRVLLRRIDAYGVATVAELDDLGETMELTTDWPGAYYVEVWIRPYHLEDALGSTSLDLMGREYLWLITNPIRIGG
ncbi:MAG: hypothetical protein ABIJ56_22800, partial [Pseudomonadota bacterium]